jgi:DNA-binding CsgD family transcriptional regulator/tetratricopeptide (TPR) repeat protein
VTVPLTDDPALGAGCRPQSPSWPDPVPVPAAWTDQLDEAGWVPQPRRDGKAGAGPGDAAGRPVFIGRARELGRLNDLLADAAVGRPRVALVEGEAGRGKSSLITEFLARHPEWPVLHASGEASEQSLPWGIVRQLAYQTDAGLLPGFPRLAGGPVPGGDPLAVGEEFFGLLAAAAGRGPAAAGRALIVVVEDLQWADQPSARALLFACRRLAAENVLVVGSARPQDLGRLGEGWTRFLTGDRRCVRLALPRLSEAEVAEFAAALGRAGLPGRGGLSGRAVRRVAGHSRGNPLFARAMLTELPDHVLEGDDSGLALPGSLTAVILPRLAALPAAARNLVTAAAVLGDGCAVSDAVVLAGEPQSDHALDQATAAGFLVAQPARRELRFTHELIRRAVYADVTAAQRRSLHRWAAALTEGTQSLRHRVAAAGGTDLDLALELDAAAAAAAGRGDPGPAAAYLTQAAELGTRGPDRARRLLGAFELLVRTADAAGAEAMRPAAEQLPAGTRRDTALGQLAMLRARPAAAEAALLAAWAAHRQSDGADNDAAVEAAAGLALLHAHAHAPDECRMWARRSMRLAPCDAGGAAMAAQAIARALAGEAEAALETFCFLPGEPALVPDAQADALTARGLLRLWTGDLSGADADLTAVVTRIGSGLRPRHPGQALGYLAETAFRLGRWDEAREHAEQAVAQAEDAGRLADLPFAHNLAAKVAAFRGDWDPAAAHVRCAEQAARVAGTQSALRFAAAARCVLALTRDDPAEVLQATAPLARGEAGFADDPTADLWHPARIWALIRTGRLDAAFAELNEFEAGAALRDDRPALVHAARLRVGLAVTQGQAEQAEAVLEACRAVADSLDEPITRALFDVEYGRCLARAHRRPAALARLRSAHEVLSRLGALPFADAVAAELGALGMRGRPNADSGLAGLTAQELQVARLVAGGMSNREAAAQLYLSPKTIEYHLAHIFAKLGIKTRYQLATLVRPAALRSQAAPARP